MLTCTCHSLLAVGTKQTNLDRIRSLSASTARHTEVAIREEVWATMESGKADPKIDNPTEKSESREKIVVRRYS